jgi:formylglycine-generating enzyme required for sulfatase activity
VYRIGQYEVSREMVTKASVEGNLGLVLHPMDFVTSGVRAGMPATGVTWNEAARFVNWLNTSKGFAPAYNFSMQPGDVGYEPNQNIELWDASAPGFNATNPYRNDLAHYFLPSVDEWYKAAYYDPNSGEYFDFPTASDSAPMAVASGTAPGTAVYRQAFTEGPADITEAGGLSDYGVMGLGGNVWEWEETEWDLLNNDGSSVRGIRGGSYNTLGSRASFQLSSSARNTGAFGGLHPTSEEFWVGFRVASNSIPEPNSAILGFLCIVLALIERRTRHRAGAVY